MPARRRRRPVPTLLYSVVAGLTITEPRPGAGGAAHVSLFGGPALALGMGAGTPVGLGAEAGIGIGYRWRWLDVAGGVGHTWDPTREAGMKHVSTVGVTIKLSYQDLR